MYNKIVYKIANKKTRNTFLPMNKILFKAAFAIFFLVFSAKSFAQTNNIATTANQAEKATETVASSVSTNGSTIFVKEASNSGSFYTVVTADDKAKNFQRVVVINGETGEMTASHPFAVSKEFTAK